MPIIIQADSLGLVDPDFFLHLHDFYTMEKKTMNKKLLKKYATLCKIWRFSENSALSVSKNHK